MTTIASTAEDYLLAGISVIPVKQDKRPSCSWATFQQKALDMDQADRLFSGAWGVAAICGNVSGGLEIIDFDAHNKDIDQIWNDFTSDENVKFIINKYGIPVERSPRGGYHFAYRYESDKYDGNQKLANWESGESMIETRGEGGYTVIFPSPNYLLISGSFEDIPVIAVHEREYLLHLARSFNRYKHQAQSEQTEQKAGFENTDPVSYFNWNHAVYARNLLKDAGWKLIRTDEKEGTEHWQRPGKSDDSISATWGKKHNSLYVFSSSAVPFTENCYYTPFQILIKLRFNGSYSAAMAWIQHKYYDEQTPYIRIGTDYFKKIKKVDRFGIERHELKPWKKEEIKQDEGKSIIDQIPKFDDFTIQPDNLNYQPVVNNCYNLYRPFLHTPASGRWEWTEVLIRHIFGDQYNIGIRYLQILYLHPAHLMPILVLVSRERQTGKTTFLNWLNMVFGDNVANISPEDLANGFNSSYASSNIIAIEETLIEKNTTVEKMKALATSKFITVNQKFVTQYRMPFYGKIIITSNNEDKFARIDDEEIRFFVRKVGYPKHSNHDIEKNLVDEIPAFLHYLTTLPPVDFSKDRSGFLPSELYNDSLASVRSESKSWLYKSLLILIEDFFNNELNWADEFYADVKGLKEKFFDRNNTVDHSFLRSVIKNEFKLEPTEKPIYFSPFGTEQSKSGRPYLFKRAFFTSKGKEDENIPF